MSLCEGAMVLVWRTPDEDTAVDTDALARMQWSKRAAGCFALQLSLIKWDKDSLLDQVYSGFSELSSQVGPGFLNSVVICVLSHFSRNPTFVTLPESPIFTI